jgi:hypothetical protein
MLRYANKFYSAIAGRSLWNNNDPMAAKTKGVEVTITTNRIEIIWDVSVGN